MDKNYQCALVYHGLSINQDGSLDPCCQYTRQSDLPVVGYGNMQYFTDTVRHRMRDDARNNIRHQGCKKCWTEEDLGLTSLRQFAEKWYPTDSDNFSFINEFGDTEDIPIFHLELRLGNFCNLKCIMCTEGSSSSVLAERVQHQDLYRTIDIYPYNPHITPWWEDQRFLDFCEQRLHRIKRINFTGGEPFIIPEVLTVLDRIDKSVTVSFNTNLTKVSNQLIKHLKKFSTVEIIVSLEGTGVKNDYVRYPSDWLTIKNNIDLLRDQVPQVSFAVNHTLQHTSVYALPELAEFCFDQSISWHMTTVQGFDFLTLQSVPSEDLAMFTQWVNSTTVLTNEQRTFLKNIILQTKYDPELAVKFQNYIGVLDQIRNTNYINTFKPSIKI